MEVIKQFPTSAREAFSLSLVDENGTVSKQSSALARLLGYPEKSITGCAWFSLLHDDDAPPVRQQFEALVSSGEVTRRWVLRFRHIGGDAVRAEVRALNLTTDPKVAAVLLSVRELPTA